MRILIKETMAIEELKLISPDNGINYISDFIGNAGGFLNQDFSYHHELDVHICSQENFDWWKKVIEDNQILEDRIFDLKLEHGSQKVMDVLVNVEADDLESSCAIINEALDLVFGEE
jgi:hypothetical protein